MDYFKSRNWRSPDLKAGLILKIWFNLRTEHKVRKLCCIFFIREMKQKKVINLSLHLSHYLSLGGSFRGLRVILAIKATLTTLTKI